MQIVRHSLILAAATLAVAAASITPAKAATKVNVPFSFVASGQSFAAGTYSVEQNKLIGTVHLDGAHGGLVWIGLNADQEPRVNRTVLKFDVINDTYYLRTVQYGAQISHRFDSKVKELKAAEERMIVGGE
jgi:hypothetical protein